MTDYNSMTDQQLDELCAEKVMGWHKWDITNRNNWIWVKDRQFQGYYLPNENNDEPVWQPCMDMNQAILAAGKIGYGWSLETFNNSNARARASVWVWARDNETCDSESEFYHGYDHQPARALVIACLMAVEQRGE